ncbi:MAG: DNA primase [Candidatus Sericytochromatia bacterium]
MSQIKEEILSRLNILDIISEHVVLKKSGSNYTGLCPFHQEKTPSFGVNPTKQIFRCFGCGEGGNLIFFHMKYHGLTFRETIRELAGKAGLDLQDFKTETKEEIEKKEQLKKSLFDLNKSVVEFYRWNYLSSKEGEIARSYIKTRGISNAMVDRFLIGYAPNSWDALYQYLKKKFTDDEIKESGLVKERENGGYYDIFRNRLIFPIQNELDQVIAFGGRAFDNTMPKYINSPETKIYIKGNNLYGLNFARNKIREVGHVILVEGYIDVIACHEFGFENAIASLGTALTTEQSKKILRYTPSKKVIVAYDSDKAGQNATDKGTSVLEDVSKGTGVDIYILKVPNGKDPDEFLRNNPSDDFQKLIDEAKPVIEYQIEKHLSVDFNNITEKNKAIDACIQILLRIDNEVYKNELIKKISLWSYNKQGKNFDIDNEIRAILKRLEQTSGNKTTNKYTKNINPKYLTEEKKSKLTAEQASSEYSSRVFDLKAPFVAEKGIIYFLIERFRALDYIKIRIKDVYFDDPVNEKIKEYIFTNSSLDDPMTWEKLLKIMPAPDYQRRIVEIWEDFDIIDISSDKILRDYIKQIQFNSLKAQGEEIRKDMEILLSTGDEEAFRKMMEIYSDIKKKLEIMKREIYSN